ncbi:MAG: carbamoylphosphate synthase large subunit, partial [Oscillospiraceae bacterium]|nr:carbamoylphosphate synthase large subunit [Oscillospiraceae bacterium]
ESTYRLKTDEDHVDFIVRKNPAVPYIMEEYVTAEVTTYDAIINSKGEAIWEGSNVTVSNLMDVVNDNGNSLYYLNKEIPADVKKAGLATVASFGVKSRFVHFEFFRLAKMHKGLGRKGKIIGLEVNMRPAGGYTPDMFNYAYSTDVYKIWADMIAFDKTEKEIGQSYFCPFIGRRDGKDFVMGHDEIMAKYGDKLKMVGRVPDALSGAMGNNMYVGLFDTKEEMDQYYADLNAVK